ncbi:hypothetical protein NQ318_012805 [Aromia moschata]|uniref:DNA polymerase delta small subunit n=1 Tax=Aromia moschata TaxID=1265417 RepID=A0AAV8XMM0_9CUCU|nr:hypothetical protein NQ318_012805 [Aromia moschata]
MSETIIERVSVNYKNLSSKFTETTTDYNKQYCAIYLARLKEMEILLRERIEIKWGDRFPVYDSDTLFMEDELQRYQLLGALDGKKLVTGITCALLGSDMGMGKFMVEDYVFADYRPQVERPLMNEDVFVIFLSGIDFLNHQNFISNLELFTHWISGMLGDESTISRIARIIIAGNSIRTVAEKKKVTMMMTSRTQESLEAIEAVKAFDYFLLQLCELVDVDVMPGEHDPSNHILPQKPMHYCMFPNSCVYKSLNQVSNPYFCSLDNLKIFGTSGQPVMNVMRFSEITDPLEVLENCLHWSHLAPTAPDTLGCYPYYEKDPFIIKGVSACLFRWKSATIFYQNGARLDFTPLRRPDGQKVRLICIPEFCNSFQAVVLNLKNLDCSSMVFSACK